MIYVRLELWPLGAASWSEALNAHHAPGFGMSKPDPLHTLTAADCLGIPT